MDDFKDKLAKRVMGFVFTTLILFTLLITRLAWVQLVKHKPYSAVTQRQYFKEIALHPSRGIIYDRNLIPLTNGTREPTLIVFKDLVERDSRTRGYIKELTGFSDEEVDRLLSSRDSILQIKLDEDKIDEINNMKGLIYVNKTLRYDPDFTLAHVIGYIKRSDNTGASGLEKGYEETLRMESNSGNITLAFDGRNRVIPGHGVTPAARDSREDPNSVKLTVDYHIQKIVENAMDEYRRNGAVVVADVETGDIVAMASRPNFDPNNILSSRERSLYNKAMEIAYPPGSIFKTVVLIAALESGLVELEDELFCQGYEEINGVRFNCNKEEGHEEITVKEGFFHSCNSVFIQLGRELGANKIIETARRLGFGDRINIGPLFEVPGNLPTGDDLLGASVGNISIGQGKIEATPLQVTNMMMIIANDGLWKDMWIVDSIVTEEGDFVKAMNRENAKRVLEPQIVALVKEAMSEVVKQGTARNISLRGVGGGGGKTGSAQAGGDVIHGWFSGYFPQDNPRYVITVFVEEGRSGSRAAAPIFEKIANEIIEIGR